MSRGGGGTPQGMEMAMAKTMKKKTASRGGANGSKAGSKSKKITAASKPRTKSELYSTIAEATELSKKQVAAVFDTLAQILAADLNKGHVVNVGGLMKVTVTRKPATKEREGINPFTGEKQIFKAKPARNVVKIRPLKSLKSMV